MNARSPPITTSLGFDIKDRASKLRKNTSGPPLGPRHSANILVVDNDPALLRLLSIRLGAANYGVECVSSAGGYRLTRSTHGGPAKAGRQSPRERIRPSC